MNVDVGTVDTETSIETKYLSAIEQGQARTVDEDAENKNDIVVG